MCRNQTKKLDFDLILTFLEYMFYPPYSSLLIVLFEDYCVQREERQDKQSVRTLLWMAVKLGFWFYFIELYLHFTRVNAFFNAPFTMISNLNNYERESLLCFF